MGSGPQDEPQPGPSAVRTRQRPGVLPREVIELLVPPVKVGAWTGTLALSPERVCLLTLHLHRCRWSLGRRGRGNCKRHKTLCQRRLVGCPVVYARNELLVYLPLPVCQTELC